MTTILERTYITPVGKFEEVVLDEERSLRLILTGACNLACEFCAYKVKDFYSPEVHSNKLVEMRPTSELRELLREMKRHLNYDVAHFTGGEPSIAKHVIQVGELCKDEGYSVNMCSNLVYTKSTLELLEKDLLDQLTFSYVPLDSSRQRSRLPTYQRPDKGRIDKTLENVLYIRSHYPDITVKTNIVISPYSDIENTKDFVTWCWDNGVIPRVQRDRSGNRISGSTENTKKLLEKLEMEPKKVILRIPGATEVCEFEDPDGRTMYVKIFNKNFRLQEVCKLCSKEEGCSKSLSSIRVYDTEEEPTLCLCTVRNEDFAHLTMDKFLESKAFEEIKGYKMDKMSYFNRFCTHPNFQ